VANPFAAAVLAHLKTRETRADPAARRAWKLRLIKSLYDRGLDGGHVRLMFKFLDSMLVLPRELAKSLSLEVAEFEKERKMPYVSSIEQIAREEGIAEGKAKGIAEGKAEGRAEGKVEAKVDTLLRMLAKRFGSPVLAELEAQIRSTHDLGRLDALIDAGLEAADLADFRRMAGI
jgi:hypothetical protein